MTSHPACRTIYNPYLGRLINEVGYELFPGDQPQFRQWTINDKEYEAHRSWMTLRYAWAIPNEEVIRYMAGHGPIVEIGAGSGYWAMLLEQVGADVVAYDVYPPDGSFVVDEAESFEKWSRMTKDMGRFEWHKSQEPWFAVRQGDVTSVIAHSRRALFLCWPPYDEPTAADALSLYEGDDLFYVGEPEGGCTGDDQFHQLLRKEWNEVVQIDIPQWWGLHDRFWHYRRTA